MGPARQDAQMWPQIAERLGKYQRKKAAEDSQYCIGRQLARVSKRNLRNTEKGFGAPEPARYHDTGDGRQNYGAKHGRAPAPDDFLNHEKNCRDGSVKSSGKSGCSSDGGEQS